MSNYEFYISQIVSGISTGCIYGLLALSLVFIYRTTTVGNFAQAEQGTSSAYFMFYLIPFLPMSLAFLFALGASFVMSALIHLLIIKKMRHLPNQDVELSELILTVGLMSVINGLNRWGFGSKIEPFPAFFTERVFDLGPTNISAVSLGIIGATLVIACFLFLFFTYTRIGINSEAVASNKLGAAARGVNVHFYMALSWGMGGLLAGIASVLAGPLMNLHPNMMTNAFMNAFVASVLGGIKSPFGALVSGVIVGVSENLAVTIPAVGSELKSAVVFVILLGILYVKPTGLFGKKGIRKV